VGCGWKTINGNQARSITIYPSHEPVIVTSFISQLISHTSSRSSNVILIILVLRLLRRSVVVGVNTFDLHNNIMALLRSNQPWRPTRSIFLLSLAVLVLYTLNGIEFVGQEGADFAREKIHLENELPFIVTIDEKVFPRPEEPLDTPNFYDILKASGSLPSPDCYNCLRPGRTHRAACEHCAEVCPGFCSKLCHEKVGPKFVSKQLTIVPPLKSRDPNRIIPRIVHQTWFEELSREKYKYLSNYTESYRLSGWEHRFYTDEDAASFLSTHFPPEFLEVFDTLVAGAFKADLFRYCVLLIHGGVYSDVDIQLASNLDVSVPPDIGFMVPFDGVSTTRMRLTYLVSRSNWSC
jgi:hypothetical protein